MKKVALVIASVLYFGFARYLPVSYSPLGFGLTKPLRGLLCRFMFKRCGKNINVERGVWFSYKMFSYNIEIGNNSGIGIDSKLYSRGGIIIGDDVMMGPEVLILTENHKHDDLTRPMREQGAESVAVVIESDVWIGMRVIILPGSRIGRSSIIGAGAVVAGEIPPFSIVVGNPARVVKRRDGSFVPSI